VGVCVDPESFLCMKAGLAFLTSPPVTGGWLLVLRPQVLFGFQFNGISALVPARERSM
jgi:hypothetical protein